MPYRKMYLYSAVFIGVIAVETLCEIAFGVSNSLSNAISLGIAVALGMQGNTLYKLHVEKKTKEIIAMNTPEQAKIELVKQGGTSVAAVVGFSVVFISIMVLIAFVEG
jgi:divalent metal cation (Fe/Co/Zn/Cd) transporter